MNKFDLLFVDAEGYDADIVSDFLKTSLIRPTIIFEYFHVPNEKLINLVKQLNEKKYIFFSVCENIFCFPEENNPFVNFN